MVQFHSNADALLVAVPMVIATFAAFFRLDELLSKPVRSAPERRQFSAWDESGEAVYIEPDGRRYRTLKRAAPGKR